MYFNIENSVMEQKCNLGDQKAMQTSIAKRKEKKEKKDESEKKSGDIEKKQKNTKIQMKKKATN